MEDIWVGELTQRTKVATDSTNLLFENLVVETRFEFTLSGVGSGDIHSSLSSAEDDEVLVGRDGGAVKRGVGYVGLEDFEVGGVDELGGLVFRGGDEVGSVGGPLEVGYLQVWLVDLDVVELFSGLILVNSAIQNMAYSNNGIGVFMHVPLHRTAKLIHPHVLQ